jgi:hypothetical protein
MYAHLETHIVRRVASPATSAGKRRLHPANKHQMSVYKTVLDLQQ